MNGSWLSAILLAALAAGGDCADCPAQSASTDREIAPRMLQPQRDASEYYPPQRIGEAGRVVLRFTVSASGKAVGPFTVDKPHSFAQEDPAGDDPPSRLVVAAAQYLKDSSFISRAPYNKVLIASFVFEFAPCGKLTA